MTMTSKANWIGWLGFVVGVIPLVALIVVLATCRGYADMAPMRIEHTRSCAIWCFVVWAPFGMCVTSASGLVAARRQNMKGVLMSILGFISSLVALAYYVMIK
jgi:hypothetical protein